jgi:PST family polysaccharide transporter
MPRQPSLRKNIAALYVVQFSNYLMPLVTLPWLTRMLGPEGFGRLNFCLAVNACFVLLADYGFNLSATREIAVHGHDRAARSAIFWNTLFAKALLGTAGLPLLLLLSLGFERLAAERGLLLIGYLLVLGNVLTPTWYFQGTERQAQLSAVLVGVRLLSVPALLLLVHSPADTGTAVAVSAGIPVVTGALCLGLLARERSLDAPRLHPAGVLGVLGEGWHLFLSTASTSLYGMTNTVLLGMLSGNTAVGYYSAADKAVQAAQGLLTPINQSVYPRISRLMGESRQQAFALIHRVLLLQGGLALALSLALFAAAPLAVRLAFGADYGATVETLRWLAFLPFLVGLSNVFGIQTMLPLGMKRSFTAVLLAAGLLNVLALLLLAPRHGAAGAAMAVCGTELFVTVAMALVLMRAEVPLFRRVQAA